jgi:hypothetical protein
VLDFAKSTSCSEQSDANRSTTARCSCCSMRRVLHHQFGSAYPADPLTALWRDSWWSWTTVLFPTSRARRSVSGLGPTRQPAAPEQGRRLAFTPGCNGGNTGTPGGSGGTLAHFTRLPSEHSSIMRCRWMMLSVVVVVL